MCLRRKALGKRKHDFFPVCVCMLNVKEHRTYTQTLVNQKNGMNNRVKYSMKSLYFPRLMHYLCGINK